MTPTGADIRALRKSRGLTLVDLATLMNRSIGWLSQVERDLSRPDADDLHRLASSLDAPLTLLSPRGTGPEAGHITRATNRRPLGERIPGLTETLLSPDLTDDYEVIHSTFAPGCHRDTPVIRPTQEIAHLLSGRLDVWLGDDPFTLNPGDTVRFRDRPFRWANPYDAPAIAIWIISPALYSQGLP